MTALQRFQGWIEQIFGAGASALPPPDVETLGGVMRNTGSAGQFVIGIGSDGALQFGTPSGVSNGIIIRGQATIQGHTTSYTPAAAPAVLSVVISSAPGNDYVWTLTVSGVAYYITWAYADPADGSVFIDLSGFWPGDGDAASLAFVNALNMAGIPGFSASWAGGGYHQANLSIIATGSTASITLTTVGGDVNVSGGGTGTDEIPAGGQIRWAQIFGFVSGKVIRPLAVWGVSSGLGQPVFIIDDYDSVNIVSAINDTSGNLISQPPDITTIAKFMAACHGNIYAYFNDAVDGGSATIYMIAELVDVPASGTFQYYTCSGFDYIAVYADGSGGFYNVTIETNSNNCGFGS